MLLKRLASHANSQLSSLLLPAPRYPILPGPDSSIDNMATKAEIIADKEILGERASISHEEAMHFGALSPDELVIQKKLLRKIDSLIMPLVVLVYLMNYIDRYVQHSYLCPYFSIHLQGHHATQKHPSERTLLILWLLTGTTTLRQGCRALRRTSIFKATNTRQACPSCSFPTSLCKCRRT